MKPTDGSHGGGHEGQEASAPTGFALVEGDLRLELARRQLPAERPEGFSFRILDANGEAVRDFEVEHDRRMHLIVVRRDLTGFQHLHPKMEPDGTWRASLDLGEPGSYRVFADFSSGGESYTLGGDVHVAGRFEPRDLPHASDSAVADGGYEVRLAEDGDQLRFTVHADGRRVDDVEPYLGARGHLVALREGDLAFLHVHPTTDVDFGATFPSAGRYRLFLQFKHEGKVRTVAFTQEVAR
jgi:hypothetical protein